jgi:hypothetical protein
MGGMQRALLVFLLGALACAPAASAEEPRAVMTTPPESVEPGKPWVFTVELNGFRRPTVPAMIGRRGGRTVGAELQQMPPSGDGRAGFRLTMLFPHEGRWRLRLFAGNRRFAFPPVQVGGDRMPQSWVAVPMGGGGRGGGVAAWVLSLAGIALAGAGVAAVRRRGSRPAPRPRSSAAPRPS